MALVKTMMMMILIIDLTAAKPSLAFVASGRGGHAMAESRDELFIAAVVWELSPACA